MPRPHRALAERIVLALFNSCNGKADILFLMDGSKYLGGWCEEACADRIEQILDAAEIDRLQRAKAKEGKR